MRGGGGSVREWNSRAGVYRHRFLTPSALSKRGASGRGASGGNPISHVLRFQGEKESEGDGEDNEEEGGEVE